MSKRPLIGIPADIKPIGHWDFHAVGDKYIRAVQEAVGDVILLPALGNQTILARLLPMLDGLCLTGSHSNVAPEHYGEPPSREGTLHDPARDATTLPLIHTAVKMGLPLLGICRGFQEINVAFGGSLHQHIQEMPNYLDHREPDGDISTQYGDAHEITFTPDSLMKKWLNADSAWVNSLHQQGIKTLGKGLIIEAHAPDGIIEAIRIENARYFGYAVQWHPEWQFDSRPSSKALYSAFKAACETYQHQKQNQ